MILKIPDVLNSSELATMMTALEGATWIDGRETAGHQAVKVKANEQLALDDPLAVSLGSAILDRLGACPLFIAAALPSRVLPPRFNRYTGSGAYGNHVDNAIFPIPGTALRLRSDLSATLFLSEPDTYDGGDLVIDGVAGEQRIKLPAGHMILYPSTSLHRVEPVTRGARYAAFFWSQSLVACEVDRRMLFELDQSIQDLVADHPDHPAIDRLTGPYHNLLRKWSVT